MTIGELKKWLKEFEDDFPDDMEILVSYEGIAHDFDIEPGDGVLYFRDYWNP